jgi:GNAT superfamily N-acetyltransferase
MIILVRTDSDNKDFIQLVKQLDAELAILDGDEHVFYAQLNKTDKIKHVIVIYENDKPLSCGAIREHSPSIMEVKRMYTIPESRGKGIATKVLNELEKWASELAYQKCILETGKRQPDAICSRHARAGGHPRNHPRPRRDPLRQLRHPDVPLRRALRLVRRFTLA